MDYCLKKIPCHMYINPPTPRGFQYLNITFSQSSMKAVVTRLKSRNYEIKISKNDILKSRNYEIKSRKIYEEFEMIIKS